VTSCIVNSAAIYIIVVKFRNTIWPPPPLLSLHTTAALSSNLNGKRSDIAERNQRAVYIVRRLWALHVLQEAGLEGRPSFQIIFKFLRWGFRSLMMLLINDLYIDEFCIGHSQLELIS
jgi:hypothetical protein